MLLFLSTIHAFARTLAVSFTLDHLDAGITSSRSPLVARSDVIGSNVTDILVWKRPAHFSRSVSLPKRSDVFRVPWYTPFCLEKKAPGVPGLSRYPHESRDQGALDAPMLS